MPTPGAGPLAGLRVLEMGAMGAAPFCATLLADWGADVLRIDRPPSDLARAIAQAPFDVLRRSRRSACIDLKSGDGVAAMLRLAAGADALIEVFRPGVMERLGLGPDACLAVNPRLVYGRITGWGQTGPLAPAAGHDINYIALAGVLGAIGEPDRKPVPPLNLVGDFGGGAVLAAGMLAALWESSRTARGQVVDSAMLDSSALLMGWILGERAAGRWRDQRGTNEVDGGRPYFTTYRTHDGKYLSVGPIEPKFFADMCRRLGHDELARIDHLDPAGWPALGRRLTEIFLTRSRDDWCAIFEGSDACVTPVLDLAEVDQDPHNAARGVFVAVAGVTQPAPTPRFSRTPNADPTPPPAAGTQTDEALAAWGFGPEEIARLRAIGAIV